MGLGGINGRNFMGLYGYINEMILDYLSII
jgi:hypothetical protein